MTRHHTVADVIAAVCRVTGVDFGRILTASRDPAITRARRIIAYLARTRTMAGWPDIAAATQRDKRTAVEIARSFRDAARLIANDPEFRDMCARCEDDLDGVSGWDRLSNEEAMRLDPELFRHQVVREGLP